MATTNIFYRIPSQRGTRVAAISGPVCTLDKFCEYIIDSEGLNRNDFIIASGTKVFRPSNCNLQSISLTNNSHFDILIPLLGGKGGFGSLLRAIGAQIEKTTNRDACRDLKGRRLRDVKKEEELKKLLALQEKLQEERKRKRKDKLDKLKKKTQSYTSSTSIQELVSMFNDKDYNERRLELGDIIKAAVEKGIINYKKRQIEESAETSPVKKPRPDSNNDNEDNLSVPLVEKDLSPTVDVEQAPTSDDKPKHDHIQVVSDKQVISQYTSKPKKNDIWLGLEDEDLI